MDARLQRRVQRYGWDKAAALYEGYWQQQLAPAQDRLIALAALQPGERVIDVAAGFHVGPVEIALVLTAALLTSGLFWFLLLT